MKGRVGMHRNPQSVPWQDEESETEKGVPDMPGCWKACSLCQETADFSLVYSLTD